MSDREPIQVRLTSADPDVDTAFWTVEPQEDGSHPHVLVHAGHRFHASYTEHMTHPNGQSSQRVVYRDSGPVEGD